MMRMAGLIAATVLCVGVCRANAAVDEQGYLGMAISWSEDPKGAKVDRLADGSPAEKAGVKAEDIVTQIDKKSFDNVEDVIAYVRGKKPGDKVTLTVIREKKEKQIDVTVGKVPDAD